MPDVKPIPDGYPRLMPYLSIAGADQALDWYAKVLGATVRMRMPGPDDSVGHAEMLIGDSVLMLADEQPDMGFKSPKAYDGTPVSLALYVEDCDATYQAAIDNGATSEREPEDQFYGDRSASFTDPFGHAWHVMTHVEDVSEEEMAKRSAEMAEQGGH